MPQVDVMQEMFVAAEPPRVAHRLAAPDVPAALWPDLTVTVSEERGLEGQRYLVAGAWSGSAELWLAECADGVLVHAYLRIDPADGAPLPARRRAVLLRRREHAMRRALWVVKDELEVGRAVGAPVPPVPPAPVSGVPGGGAR